MLIDIPQEMIAVITLAMKQRAYANRTGTVKRAAEARDHADLAQWLAIVEKTQSEDK